MKAVAAEPKLPSFNQIISYWRNDTHWRGWHLVFVLIIKCRPIKIRTIDYQNIWSKCRNRRKIWYGNVLQKIYANWKLSTETKTKQRKKCSVWSLVGLWFGQLAGFQYKIGLFRALAQTSFYCSDPFWNGFFQFRKICPKRSTLMSIEDMKIYW